ncbi:MAG TPA: phosphoserine phosphatase SerB [Burkholderiales bacterium]|nr:phosphoserine phosphatase SerB [Burkholderiales bacterium]
MSVDLVIQGLDVETSDLKRLAKLSGASGIEQLDARAFRLRGGEPAAGIEELCAEHELDCAFVPRERGLADFRLLVMDMDSTLITIETVDELADMVGLKNEVAAITAQAMRGEIEYNESLERRVALLAGLEEHALQRVYDERLKLSPGAEILLKRTQALGIKTLLVSGGFTYVTDRLKTRLGLDHCHSNVLEIADGRLTGKVLGAIVNAEGKREALIRMRDELGITRERIIGIGDGANDLKFMAEAGVSVAYHAKPVVRQHATHAINYVHLDGVLHLFNQ